MVEIRLEIFVSMSLKVRNCRSITFKGHCDVRGWLYAFEELKNVPFKIKRVYTISNIAHGATRGEHAHFHLEQLIICISGHCNFLLDDGKNKEVVVLNTPKIGLYVGTYIWHKMFDFSQDCILLALASDFYDVDDYIHNYGRFLEIVKNDPLL